MNWIKNNIGLCIFLALILVLGFVLPIHAATLQATLGGQDSSGNYHYTIDSDGVMAGASGSVITAALQPSGTNSRVVNAIEVMTATQEVCTSADNGLTYIIDVVTAGVDFTLPDCSTDPLDLGFLAATNQVITLDTYSTLEYIKYTTIPMDAGDALDSPGATSNYTRVKCFKADNWVAYDMVGTWVDGGAN